MLDINQIDFHDTFINGIEISTIQDHFDHIVIQLESTRFMSDFGTPTIGIIFEECFMADLKLQMWITGKDTVRHHTVFEDSPLLQQVEALNSRGMGPKAGELIHFQMELNTSGSVLDILAKSITICPQE